MEQETEMNRSEFRASYEPESNKLRLYCGRVPRDEYLKLKAAGWVALHKQREAGGGDFAAVWTPSRRDTALEYGGGIIDDEDMGPEERAADRAERFSGYRDKRTDEATGHADSYDAGPSAHGYQSQARAERSAARYNRIADRAGDAWSKAEYWQTRTAGVIRHALHKSAPGVRMGRIKTLEAELRRFAGSGGDWETHLTLRLAYENQMLAAQGGRLEQQDVQAGGKLGGKLIIKASKSSVTGRVTSVKVIGPKVGSGWHYQVSNIPGTEFAEYHFDTERIAPGAYTPPTPESLAELAAFKKSVKAAAPEKAVCPLINPTDADAERLQAIFNANLRDGYDAGTVERITQSVYSANSGGEYAACKTVDLTGGGFLKSNHYMSDDAQEFPTVAKVRVHGRRVVILSDKPTKPFPDSLWHDPRPGIVGECVANVATIREALSCAWSDKWTPEQKGLIQKAASVGLVSWASMTQFHITKKGVEVFAAADGAANLKASNAAERAAGYEAMDRKRADAGAQSVNAKTGELAFA